MEVDHPQRTSMFTEETFSIYQPEQNLPTVELIIGKIMIKCSMIPVIR